MIGPYEDDQTAIFHSYFAQIQIKKNFFLSSLPPTVVMVCSTSWMDHKTYGRFAQFDSAISFASTNALVRSIEGACGMSPYLSALETPQSKPRSKHLYLSYERAFRAYAANQEIDVEAQQNIRAANQDTAEHSTTYVQPIRSEKIKQWRRDRPRSDALVLRAVPASYRGVPA
jgi:hypothetical protein